MWDDQTLSQILRLFEWGNCELVDSLLVLPQAKRPVEAYPRQRNRVARSPVTILKQAGGRIHHAGPGGHADGRIHHGPTSIDVGEVVLHEVQSLS